MEGTFVFVVCGGGEHIDTLHFSLKYLKKYTNKDIIVLTDSSRNEKPVEHTNIIDVSTPEVLDHHQASIYLKVGIHHHLPKGKQYCYIDTDVIALSHNVNQIFEEFRAPIRFAPDHCKVNIFSPLAVNCGCLEKKQAARVKLHKAWDAFTIKDVKALEKQEVLQEEFERLKNNRLSKILMDLKFKVSGKKPRLNSEFWFDKEDRVWYDNQNTPILYEFMNDHIARETGLKFNEEGQFWMDDTGGNVWLDNCNHLAQQIKKKFQIEVEDNEWQHWNGGVFLFNDSSHDFLESWFEKTMLIFKDSEWKTRDQGTLIATAWEYKLHQTLPLEKKWNFLADYKNPEVSVNEETGMFTDDGFKTSHQAAFVHVYHHFGDTDWELWNWILRQFGKVSEVPD